MITNICHCCGRSFDARPSTKQKYCSRECFVAWPARLWKKIERRGDKECWPYKGALNSNGYGQFSINTKPIKAHRAAYIAAGGTIGTGLFVCHHCDNPSCCNPAHLFLGTAADNNKDSARKGRTRGGGPPGESNGQAKLTAVDVVEVKRRLAEGVKGASLARAYSVSKSAISKINRRRTWTRG